MIRSGTPRKCKILTVGDSTCFGYSGITGLQVADPYPLQMMGLLNSPYFTRSHRIDVGGVSDKGGCINLGLNGRKLSQITLAEIEVHRPDIVIVTAGVNDLALGDSAATLISNYTALIAAIQGIGSIVIADEMLPIGLATGPEADRITVNAWLHSTSAANVVTTTASDSRMSTLVIGDWYDISGHPTGTNSGTDIGGGYGVKAIYCAAAVRTAMQFRAAA